MLFLGDLDRITLREVEELLMGGLVGPLEPLETELPMFLKRIPGLTELITNEEMRRHSASHWTVWVVKLL